MRGRLSLLYFIFNITKLSDFANMFYTNILHDCFKLVFIDQVIGFQLFD